MTYIEMLGATRIICMLINLIFQFGDFYGQKDDSSLWEGLLGAFIGAGGALLVYYLETRRERKKETKSKADNESNTLVYFTSLVQSVLEKSETQVTSYKSHSKTLIKDPLGLHPLPLVVAEDLNRVINKFDHEKIFHAYLSKFNNSKERIQKFQKIYTQLDSIHKIYEYANFTQESYLKEILDRLTRYKDIAEEKTLNYSVSVTNKIKNTNPTYQLDPLYQLLDNAVINYHNNAPNPKTIEYLQTGFINVISSPLVQNFRHLDDGIYLIDHARKATWLYNETIQRTQLISGKFDNYSSDLKNVVGELKILVSDLN